MSAIAASKHFDQSGELGRRIALLSMAIGALLAIIKVLVGIRAGSNALVSDGIEGAGDVLSSGIIYGGLLLASKPPDAEHPYGHGRYETLAGLAVGALLLLTGAAIFWHGITSFGTSSVVRGYAVYPLIAAIVLKLGLAGVKFRVANRIGSTGLHADAWHDVTDLVSTSVALLAVGLTLLNPALFYAADHAGTVVIGILILALAVRVHLRTIGYLLDTMPEPSRLREIRAVALRVPGTQGIEKCYARRTGLTYHVDLHLEVDPDMTVRESHEIATEVKNEIKTSLSWVADVLVHVEPSGMGGGNEA